MAEQRKTISLQAGVDCYKYHAGLLVDVANTFFETARKTIITGKGYA